MSLNNWFHHLANDRWLSGFKKTPEVNVNGCASIRAVHSICADRSYRDRDSECADQDIGPKHGYNDR